MGEAKRRSRPVLRCIYCGRLDNLSDEHVIPFGLGGQLVLPKASCAGCAAITGALEQRLLRGHWWPYRRRLGFSSRRPHEQPTHVDVKIVRPSGEQIPALLPIEQHSLVLVFNFDPPSILSGKERPEVPFGTNVSMKQVDLPPRSAIVDGKIHILQPDEKIDIPVNLDAADVTRFLAKVAHSFVISRRGVTACSQYFLPPIILGSGDGALTYVGNAKADLLGPRLPGPGVHALLDRANAEFLSVYVQLFRDAGDPPPIYEVVVGRLQ